MPLPLGLSSVEVGADFFFVVGGVVSLRCIVLNFFLTRLVLEFLFTFERVGKVVAMGDGVALPFMVVTVVSLGEVGSRYLL